MKQTTFTLFRERLKRLVYAKNVVVVSKHAVDHYSISMKMQLAIGLGIIAVVSTASFSTGRYIQAAKTIRAQHDNIIVEQTERKKMSNEYSLLKSDLLRMSEDDDAQLSDYTKFVIDQYQANAAHHDLDDSTIVINQQPASAQIMRRINFLEQQLESKQFQHQQFLHSIHLITRDKIKALERAVKMTGMEDEISHIMERSFDRNAYNTVQPEPDTSFQGGPLHSIDDDDFMNHDSVIQDVTLLAHMTDTMEHLPISHPMATGRFTSGFGHRVDPIKRTLARHTGIDYAGKHGSKIVAAGAGKVIYASYKGAYGKTVDIDHGNGFMTRYSHMSRILVRNGQTVTSGKPIGVQGTTGRSTGHHLHFEVRYKGKPINPIRFIRAGQHVSKTIKQDG